MCVCVCVCVCVCFVYMNVLFIYIYIFISMHEYTYMYTHTNIHYSHAYSHLYIHIVLHIVLHIVYVFTCIPLSVDSFLSMHRGIAGVAWSCAYLLFGGLGYRPSLHGSVSPQRFHLFLQYFFIHRYSPLRRNTLQKCHCNDQHRYLHKYRYPSKTV